MRGTAALYEDLYNAVGDICRYAHFVAVEGSDYRTSPVRLMVVGRAVNGWVTLPSHSAEAFGAAAREKSEQAGFTWVTGEGDNMRSLHDENYRLNRSPFWRITRRILAGLCGRDAGGRWIERIAWSNLYKVSPRSGGNPSNALCRSEIIPCRAILSEEIERLSPTHIFMPVGWRWFHSDERYDFSQLFCDAERSGAENGTAVEGTAQYLLHNGLYVPTVIASRPEFRREGPYVEEVLASFKKLAADK